eukprot:5230021-Amphidinium_carterae.1
MAMLGSRWKTVNTWSDPSDHNTPRMQQGRTNVLAEYFVYLAYITMTKFRMVAEQVHRLRRSFFLNE